MSFKDKNNKTNSSGVRKKTVHAPAVFCAPSKDELVAALAMENGTVHVFNKYFEKEVPAEVKNAVFMSCFTLFFEQNNATAGALLCRACKRNEFKEQLRSMLRDSEALRVSIAADSPKMRKNAARLAGELGCEEYLQPLLMQLEREQTRFVVPSILLAIGSIGGKNAGKALNEYQVAPAEDESELKHCRECEQARELALSSLKTGEKHAFTDLIKPRAVELRVSRGLGNALLREIKERKGTTCELNPVLTDATDDSVTLICSSITELFCLRSFREVMIPLADSVKLDPLEIAKECKSPLLELLSEVHQKSDSAFKYRIELKCRAELNRADFIHELSQCMKCAELENSASDYEAELRIEESTDALCKVYLKLFSFNDPRFTYRKAMLSAGIAPANAAALIYSARDYLKENAIVLDCCCGGGTMLLERARVTCCKTLVGVDVFRSALRAAGENARAAGERPELVCMDCTEYSPSTVFDEVIVNLPFGNRVGTHEDNKRLYEKILKKLPAWLPNGGIALLYTADKQLMSRLIAAAPRLVLKEKIASDAGGLTPTLFIVRVKKQ